MHEHLPTLESENLRLRWLTEVDAPSVFEIFANAEVARYWSTPMMTEVTQAERLIESIHEKFASGDLFQWGLAHGPADRVIGTCTLADIDRANQRAELGFALNRNDWGRGLMGEALQTLITHAFGALDLRRLEADIDPRNAPSIRTCERLGFKREGYLRERWVVAGEVCDTVLYGLLRSEYVTE